MANGPLTPESELKVGTWLDATDPRLVEAIRACWHGRGTPAQRALLSAWVEARVMGGWVDVDAVLTKAEEAATEDAAARAIQITNCNIVGCLRDSGHRGPHIDTDGHVIGGTGHLAKNGKAPVAVKRSKPRPKSFTGAEQCLQPGCDNYRRHRGRHRGQPEGYYK